MRHLRWVALIVLVAGFAAVGAETHATERRFVAAIGSRQAVAAAQHANAHAYAYWDWSGRAFWNVDQIVVVKQKARATYWATYWTWTDASYGGYMGLQTDGSRGDGTVGEMVIFSLWNANAARGPRCLRFGGEGVGWSCRLAYPIATDRMYRYRLWRLNEDAGGQWWGAWIKDLTTGVETYIGSIRVARTHDFATGVMNFSEYFGTQVPCTGVPMSIADFTQPAANQRSPGVYQYGSTYRSSHKGSCTGGAVSVVSYGWTRAARVTLGG